MDDVTLYIILFSLLVLNLSNSFETKILFLPMKSMLRVHYQHIVIGFILLDIFKIPCF